MDTERMKRVLERVYGAVAPTEEKQAPDALRESIRLETEAAARLREWAETVLDWAHHKKFDPLMKLRGRRRRTGLGGV